MTRYYTALIEYDKPENMPRVHAHMEALGGKVVAINFGNALAELEGVEAQRDEALAQCDALLEALRDALELIETISPIEGHVVRAARAATAKAEGK